jgi:hypothetical protein
MIILKWTLKEAGCDSEVGMTLAASKYANTYAEYFKG